MKFLINCFVCGGQVSRSASVCPHCGEPHFKAKDQENYLLLNALTKKEKQLREQLERNNEIIREGDAVENEEREERMKEILERLDRLTTDE
jgi:hypothetical protein